MDIELAFAKQVTRVLHDLADLAEKYDAQLRTLQAKQAELRDEVRALANRIETLAQRIPPTDARGVHSVKVPE